MRMAQLATAAQTVEYERGRQQRLEANVTDLQSKLEERQAHASALETTAQAAVAETKRVRDDMARKDAQHADVVRQTSVALDTARQRLSEEQAWGRGVGKRFFFSRRWWPQQRG